MPCNNIWSRVPQKWKFAPYIWSVGGRFLPWSVVPVIWKNASQVWSKSWLECMIPDVPPIPPTPPVAVIEDMSGALPQPEYVHPWAKLEKKKKKKKVVELTCIVGEIRFNEKKEVEIDDDISFKIDDIKLLIRENREHAQVAINNPTE